MDSEYVKHYSRVVRYGRKIPVESMHPDLAWTLLGAHLRKAAEHDDDIGRLSAAALTNADHEGNPRLKQPLELTALHALRDAIMENPSHPLAKEFGWHSLPEEVALDSHVKQMMRELAPNQTARRFLDSGGIYRLLHDDIRKQFPWADPAARSAAAARIDRHREVKDAVRRFRLDNPKDADSWHSQTLIQGPESNAERYGFGGSNSGGV